MGTGYHGGFGETSRYRVGYEIPKTEKTLEMALDPKLYAVKIAKKLNIHLRVSGKQISIIFNSKLPPGIAGITRKNNPYVIEIGPSALASEIELANTIAHKLNHARSFIRGGDAPEQTAYNAGDTLEDYMRGKR